MLKAFGFLPLLLSMGTSAFAAIPEEWKKTPYAYEANQSQLSMVLQDFVDAFGMKLDMPPLDGILIDGRIRTDTPQAFLDRLALEHHFQWFVFNETLYVSPQQEQVSQRIEVSPDTIEDLKEALTDVGLLDSRFGWGLLPDQGVVLVSGPAKYVKLIRDYSAEVETADQKQEVIVLPLQYANAADRTIQYRDQQVTISGVATILQELLEGGAKNKSFNNAGRNVVQNLGTSFQGAAGAVGQLGTLNSDTTDVLSAGSRAFGSNSFQRGAGNTSSSKRPRVRVSADIRNNAVLIYDTPERKVMYETLIKQLDVPRNLIEIDAIIVDIDRNELAEFSNRWNFNAGSVSGGASLMDAGASSTLFIQDRGRFSEDLRALEGKGAASVIGNPSILTLENQPAVIDFNRTEFLTTVGERVADSEAITAGTSLQVIPRTLRRSGHAQVQLVVDIEDGQIDASALDETKPSVRRGTISTQAVVGEHASLVIGGLHVQEANDKLNKIPLLGDIPWLGKWLFSSKQHDMSHRERLFILTPRMVGDQVNPVRYVEHGNPHEVDDTVKRIAQRRKDNEQPTRTDIQEAFMRLVDSEVPEGFQLSTQIPFMVQSL